MSSMPLLRKRRSATSSSLSKKNVSRKQDFAYDESSLSDTDCSETKHGSSFYISSAVRHMAWWRISLFLIMWMEWNSDNVLWFQPMKREYTVKVLDVPDDAVVGLLIEKSLRILLKPGDSHKLRDVMDFEISMPAMPQLPGCSQSSEDTLIAILWN